MKLTVVPTGHKTARLKFLRLLNEPVTSLEVEIRKRIERLVLLRTLNAPEVMIESHERALATIKRIVQMVRDGRQGEVDAELKAGRKTVSLMRGCKVGYCIPDHYCTPECQKQLEPGWEEERRKLRGLD